MTNYPYKPDERLLAHFATRYDLEKLENTEVVRNYLKSLGFNPHSSFTDNKNTWPFIELGYMGGATYTGVKEGKHQETITLDQLKAEVAEVLGDLVASEPEEKPLSRQKFVTTAKKLEMLNRTVRNLEQQIEDTKAEISETFKILREADNVRFKDDGVGVEAYEWSDDGFKTYTGRKV